MPSPCPGPPPRDPVPQGQLQFTAVSTCPWQGQSSGPATPQEVSTSLCLLHPPSMQLPCSVLSWIQLPQLCPGLPREPHCLSSLLPCS